MGTRFDKPTQADGREGKWIVASPSEEIPRVCTGSGRRNFEVDLLACVASVGSFLGFDYTTKAL